MNAREIIEGETPKSFLRQHIEPKMTVYAYEDGDPFWLVTQDEASHLARNGYIEYLDGDEFTALGCYDWEEVDAAIKRLRSA